MRIEEIAMKRFGITFLLLLLTLNSYAGIAKSQPAQTDCDVQKQKYEDARKQYSQAVATAQAQQKRQAEEYDKQMAMVESQSKQQQEMLEKGKSLLMQQEATVAKQAELQERFSKILGVWEKQQEQYQKYLNNLTSTK